VTDHRQGQSKITMMIPNQRPHPHCHAPQQWVSFRGDGRDKVCGCGCVCGCVGVCGIGVKLRDLNAQNPTPNVQGRCPVHGLLDVGRWVLGVGVTPSGRRPAASLNPEPFPLPPSPFPATGALLCQEGADLVPGGDAEEHGHPECGRAFEDDAGQEADEHAESRAAGGAG